MYLIFDFIFVPVGDLELTAIAFRNVIALTRLLLHFSLLFRGGNRSMYLRRISWNYFNLSAYRRAQLIDHKPR